MNLKKELPLLTIVLLPFVYLAYIWQSLPEKIPMHWNVNGAVTRYGEKIELIIIPVLLPLFTYVVFLLIPKIDPKNNLNNMGNKLKNIKFLITTIMSIMAVYIIYKATNNTYTRINYLVFLIGVLYTVSGNYLKTIKSNYFIGIKTPWTLENKLVWKKTHKWAGQLWLVGGVIVVVASLTMQKKIGFILFLIITGVISILPVVYSYLIFKKEAKALDSCL